MSLSKVLRELDKLTSEEKLQAIQYLTNSLIQKSSPIPPIASISSSPAPVEATEHPSEAENAPKQPTSSLVTDDPDHSRKARNATKKTYKADIISETAPDGTRVVAKIPSRDMIHDYAEKIWEALSESQDKPSVPKQEFAYECANFIRIVYEIRAKAMIRKEITGSEYPEKPPVETKKRRRQENERPEQKMIISRVGDGLYHIDYEDVDSQDATMGNNSPPLKKS